MKKHISNSKFIQLLIIVTGLFIVFPSVINAQNTNIKSPALETLIEQINENYVPTEWSDEINSMEKLSGIIPQIYFTFLGAAMNKQVNYINNNPIASENYTNLDDEILSLIPNLVYVNNNSTSDFSKPTNADEINGIYGNAIIGNINEGFNEIYKKNTGKELSQINMPSVLDQEIVGGTSFRKVARKDEDEIGLLGVAVIGPANVSDVVKRNAVSGTPKGQICPDQFDENFDSDTNGIPGDGTFCYCNYENGFLTYEHPIVNGEIHGMGLSYGVKNGIRFLESTIPWINGKMHGISLSYDICSGVRYLRYQTPYINNEKHGEVFSYSCYTYHENRIGLQSIEQYVNGKKHGIAEHYYMTDDGLNYLKSTTNYVNGIVEGEWKEYQVSKTGKHFLWYKKYFINIDGKHTRHGDFIRYHSSGGVQAINKYNRGELISTKCFYKNGNQIKIATDKQTGYPCDYSVDFSKTDWNED